MTYRQFLSELRALRKAGAVFHYEGSISRRIRADNCDCPILAVARARGECPYSSPANAKWPRIAKRLGLNPKTAEHIIVAADTTTKPGTDKRTRRVRAEMIAALGMPPAPPIPKIVADSTVRFATSPFYGGQQ